MPDGPATARIDRLVLEIPGSTADQGREVARLVVAGLANAGELPQAGDLPTLRVTVSADDRGETATLARRILAATLRELSRSL